MPTITKIKPDLINNYKGVMIMKYITNIYNEKRNNVEI